MEQTDKESSEKNQRSTGGFLKPPTPHLFRKALEFVVTENVFSFQGAKWFRELKRNRHGHLYLGIC